MVLTNCWEPPISFEDLLTSFQDLLTSFEDLLIK